MVNELNLVELGGSPALSYQIDYDKGTNKAEWHELQGFSANELKLSVVQADLEFIATYYVRYRVKNIFGWGEYSDISFIETIMVPDVPAPVTTALVGTNVAFNWVAPDERGSPILHYNLKVQTSTGDFILDPSYCNTV